MAPTKARGYDRARHEIWSVLKSFADFGYCRRMLPPSRCRPSTFGLVRPTTRQPSSPGCSHDPGMYPKRLILLTTPAIWVSPSLGLDVNASQDTLCRRAPFITWWTRTGHPHIAICLMPVGTRSAPAPFREAKGIQESEVAAIVAGQTLPTSPTSARTGISRPGARAVVRRRFRCDVRPGGRGTGWADRPVVRPRPAPPSPSSTGGSGPSRGPGATRGHRAAAHAVTTRGAGAQEAPAATGATGCGSDRGSERSPAAPWWRRPGGAPNCSSTSR